MAIQAMDCDDTVGEIPLARRHFSISQGPGILHLGSTTVVKCFQPKRSSVGLGLGLRAGSAIILGLGQI